jgi:antitoxin component of MazEF toxin-antitoxin module
MSQTVNKDDRSQVEIECKWPSTLNKDGYVFREDIDKSRNALIVPKAVLNELAVSEYRYVEVSAAGNYEDVTLALQVLTFEDVPASGPPWKASLRTNLMDELPGDPPAVPVRISSLDIKYSDQKLESYPGYSDDIVEYDYCYLSESVISDVDAEPTEYVEVYNPEHGGRMPLRVRELRDIENDETKALMSGQARNVLQVETGDKVSVRECVHAQPPQPKWWERTLATIVGFRELGLRVQTGRDRDEHRNVVRISEDVMEILAVESGDQIILEWGGTPTSVRCLPPENTDLDPMEILIPSTVRDRDQFDVSIHDSVHVRRNVLYILKKQVAFSTLGILGVVVGGLQVAVILNLSLIVASLLILFTSFFMIWLLMLPERQRCARGD